MDSTSSPQARRKGSPVVRYGQGRDVTVVWDGRFVDVRETDEEFAERYDADSGTEETQTDGRLLV